jgi:monooxygenase
MNKEHFDVIIVGAGLSGIGAAWHLQDKCPGKTYAVLESRDAMGGTWDLFRYPGIRSDSDMHSFGYNFKPWLGDQTLADGPSIRRYIEETASMGGVNPHIHYQTKVKEVRWSSAEARWEVHTEQSATGEPGIVTCNFISMCAGYYSYDKPHMPVFPNQDAFRGPLVCPQTWPEDLDYKGKKVVVIGSGATAVTLIPSMAPDVEHITMLQRSPTFMSSMAGRSGLAKFLNKVLPAKWAYNIVRFITTNMQQIFYAKARKDPEKIREWLLKNVRKELGQDYDVDTHFNPSYNPWDQRICAVKDGDLFKAVREGKAEVVTDNIKQFTETGIELESGKYLDADIIISATGLTLNVMGDVQVFVDDRQIDLAQTWTYKGLMTTEVPNLMNTYGYVNASWTLRADLNAEYMCRLLKHMESTGTRTVLPRLRPQDNTMPELPWIRDFTAGYMQRMMHLLPHQGDREPWVNTQNFFKDRKMLRKAPVDDGVLTFS